MQTKTIGVVIPIYNVEKYLKECLDSVINQTYTNLEIILVNDGSTDENSLNIAKEYTLKDKRITLFDKKNGGQSTARNVGIEYFSGEYKLKNKTQTLKENSLIEFNIEGNNPYEIYTVYKSYKAFNNEQDLTSFTYPIIDYIIFLDSDDYWELNCIEECVPRMEGVDVLWFDIKTVLDGVNHSDWKSNIKWLNLSRECILGRDDWLRIMYEAKMRWFYFAVMGMINFNFLKNIRLKFIDYIVQEDDHFGILLFSQMKYCYILPKELYLYRIRSNSTMAYDAKINHNSIPSFFKKYLNEFNNDTITTKYYFHTSSHVKTCMALLNFFKEQNDELLVKSLSKYLLPIYIKNAYEIVHFAKDPLNLLSCVKVIKANMSMYNIKPHGAEFRFKNELQYKIGSVILSSCKSLKKICKLPVKIFNIFKENKTNKTLLNKRNAEDIDLILPSLCEYDDYHKIDRLKEHLTYKIGVSFLKGHKYRYFGGYIIFLILVLNIIFKHSKKKKSKNISPKNKSNLWIEDKITQLSLEVLRVDQKITHLFSNVQFDDFSKAVKANFVRIINLKLPYSFFLKLDRAKKCAFIDITDAYMDNYHALKDMDNINFIVCEPNLLKFKVLQSKKFNNLDLYNFFLGDVDSLKRIFTSEYTNNPCILMPNFQDIPGTNCVMMKNIALFLEEDIDSELYDIVVLNITLDFNGFLVLKNLINTGLCNRFEYIFYDFKGDFFKECFYKEIQDLISKNNLQHILYRESIYENK